MSKNSSEIDRRLFLSSMAATGLFSSLLTGGREARGDESPAESEGSSLFPAPIRSYPVLQNPTERSVSVVWGVGALTTGWVEWGKTENLGNLSRTTEFGLNQLEEKFLYAKLENLEPNSTYYYRTATCPVNFTNAYNIKTSEPVYSEIYSFTTPGKNKAGTKFTVMNDTHEAQETLKALFKRTEELDPDQVIWNGDLLNSYERPEQILDSVFCPHYGPLFTKRPLLFNNGNHDHRGIWARQKSDALRPWAKRNREFDGLGRNFVLRQGPLALIGLDTGEDKPDANPVFAGLAGFEAYRERQAKWLASVLESPKVKKAPFVVALCHIPIFDSNPNANPGDIMEDFAAWQRPAAQMWGPLLKRHGVQLVIAAHMHAFRYDEPTADRPWGQLVGGGPELQQNSTIIYGEVDKDRLVVTAEKLSDRSILGSWTYAPRQV